MSFFRRLGCASAAQSLVIEAVHSSVCILWTSSNILWTSAAFLEEEGVFAILTFDFLIWLSSSVPTFSSSSAKVYCKITFPLTEILSDCSSELRDPAVTRGYLKWAPSERGRSVFFSSVALGMSAHCGGCPTLRSSGSIQLHTLFFMHTFSFVCYFTFCYLSLLFWLFFESEKERTKFGG